MSRGLLISFLNKVLDNQSVLEYTNHINEKNYQLFKRKKMSHDAINNGKRRRTKHNP